jgi:Domain of unknown function (DUF4158)
MKQVWSDAELNGHWLLTQDDYKLLRSKTELSRLALALQLKHYQLYARFPNQLADIAPSVVEYVSFQIDTVTDDLVDYNCNGRTSRQHRRKIFSYLKVRPFDKHAAGIFRTLPFCTASWALGLIRVLLQYPYLYCFLTRLHPSGWRIEAEKY